MTALTVLIIRHAEKPQPDGPEPGLGEHGGPDPRSLTLRGWQRAGAWAARFGALANHDYPQPGILYTVDPDVADQDGKLPSRRPSQTIVPLASRLGLVPRLRPQGMEQALAAEIAGLTGVVLLAWEHKRIGEALLPGLLAGQPLAALPARWPKARFDAVLRLDRAARGAAWSTRQLLPRLLAGDLDEPL